MSDRDDDQIPEPTGRGNCTECGEPLAPDQRYCLNCGRRRGLLPGAIVATLGVAAAKGRAAAAKVPKPKEEAGWSWIMPSPPAIAIAVIGMLALGVGLGSAMSEVANSAPVSAIVVEYPDHHKTTVPVEEPEEEEAGGGEEAIAEAPEETFPEFPAEPFPSELILPPEPTGPIGGEEGGEEESALEKSIRELEEQEKEREREASEVKELPEVKHAWLIVLGENSYESTFGPTGEAPYLSRTLPKKGELIPNYYGVTGGVLANEIALLSGQGPTLETSANCPNYTAITPGTVSETAEQVEGNGCVYANTVESLPTQLTEKELRWRSYVEDIEKAAEVGQPTTCRKPALGGPDSSPTPVTGDQYATWRNPVVYFGKVAEDPECGKLDVGFEALTRDLKSKKKTPALSLIFPDACHSGGEIECEPGAPKGAKGVASLLKTLVPAIMASPAYEEGGLILITSAQAPQAGEHPDPTACCLAPLYPNVPAAAGTSATAATTPGTTTTPTTTAPSTTKTTGDNSTSTSPVGEVEEETPIGATTTYTEESVLTAGGGGKVGLLIISPFVEPGKVEEFEYANHFTLLKTLETMLGVEPLGYATEEEMPTLNPELFLEPEAEEEVEAEPAGKTKTKTP